MVLQKTSSTQIECPSCNQPTELGLQTCTMCRNQFCHRCAVAGYGREFCSDRCRAMFFHGDGDDLDE